MASHFSLGDRANILVRALQTGPKVWCRQEAAFENSAFGMSVSESLVPSADSLLGRTVSLWIPLSLRLLPEGEGCEAVPWVR